MNYHEKEHQEVIRSLTDALFILMDKQVFSTITVTDLIQKAGVSRATYYRNFDSMEQIIELHIRHILGLFSDEYPTQSFSDRYSAEHLVHVLSYAGLYVEHLSILKKSGLSYMYLDQLNRFLIKLYKAENNTHMKMLIYSFAGAEFNLIFNVFLENPSDSTGLLLKYADRLFRDENMPQATRTAIKGGEKAAQ